MFLLQKVLKNKLLLRQQENEMKKRMEVAEMNAKNESYCICTQEYTGDICDKKTGCYGDPCKYGKCTNDPKDLTKFTFLIDKNNNNIAQAKQLY